MRALKWADVNFDKRQLCVERGEWRGHITATKGNRLRHVPLTKRLLESLRSARHLRGPLVFYRQDQEALTEKDILFAFGDARGTGQSDSGTRGSPGSRNNPAVYARQSSGR